MMNAPSDGLPTPQRYWAVLVVSIGIGMSVLDGAIANIALPTIASDLRTSAATSIWVVNAYQLAVIASLLAFAVLGDMYGYKRVYRGGLVVFTLASAGCALSDTLPLLISARIIQGLGAGAVMSVNTALARCIYPKKQLGRGIGLNALVVALSAAAGPTMASAILAVTTWQWLFAINLPFGLVAALLAKRMLPTNPLHKTAVFDLPSTALNAAFFILLIISIDNLGHASAVSMAISFLLAAVIGYVFVRRQLTLPLPLLPVDLLKIRLFSLSVCTSICSFSAQMLAMVSLPFYLQQVLGRTEVMTGLLMTPWPIAIMIIAPWSGRLVDRHAPGKLCALGMLIFSAGLLSLALLTPQASNGDIIWRMLLTGTGFGFFQAPNNFAIVASVPHKRSGGASGMQGMARLLGQTFGTTLVGLLFSWYGQLGTQRSLQLAALFALVAALISAMRMKQTD
jgi:DHA2 family multidrug resistance protein-like MFS transporter